MFHGFLQLGGEAFHEKRVRFKDAEKICGTRLAISEDGEGVGIIAEGYT